MTTLRDLWISRGLSSTEMAARAQTSTTTLYKMNRKEQVAARTIANVCRALGITRDEYDALDVCPMADRYRQP